MSTASGLSDYDYQNLSNLTMGIKNLNQTEIVNKFPIPTEIMEHFKSKYLNLAIALLTASAKTLFSIFLLDIKCHCMMGLFPEIGRAWLTIDSDIYVSRQ